MSPAIQSQSVDAGGTASSSVKVFNLTPKTVTLELGARNLKAARTGSSLTSPTNRNELVTSWVTPEARTVTLKPGYSVTVEIVVSVPKDADPASYVVGITATSRSKAPSGATGVTAYSRVVSTLVVDVNGTARKKFIARASSSTKLVFLKRTAYVTAEIENTGMRYLSVQPEVRLDGIIGVNSGIIQGREVATLPGGKRIVSVHLTDLPLVGLYRPTLTLSDGTATTKFSYPAVWVLPPWWILVALVAAVALPVWRRRRRY